MKHVPTPSLRTPAARLGAYGVILAAALGGGAVVGAAVGPEPSDPPAHDEHAGAVATPPGGSSATSDGYHLQLDTPVVDAGRPATLQFVVHDPDGDVLTDYAIEHTKELHLVVVARDLRSYAHVHPTRDDAGTWTVEAPALPAGPHRLYADFTPAGGDDVTLGADLGVAGDYAPQPVPDPSSSVTVDGYEVSFDGTLVAGRTSELAVTVSRGGEPVADLEPYLGALGHLVAIRADDMAYLHVHPADATDGPGGPTVRFAVDVPAAGTYGLFFDFAHDGVVRNAGVTTTAGTSGATDADVTTSDGDHGEHDG